MMKAWAYSGLVLLTLARSAGATALLSCEVCETVAAKYGSVGAPGVQEKKYQLKAPVNADASAVLGIHTTSQLVKDVAILAFAMTQPDGTIQYSIDLCDKAMNCSTGTADGPLRVAHQNVGTMVSVSCKGN